MVERRHIEAMIERKEQEIQGLEESIKEANVYLQALRDVLKKFPKETGNEGTTGLSLRPGSMVAQAREIILKTNKPLHVDEILKAQGKELTRDNRTGLGGSLSAYVRKGEIFTRVAPNTFGLLILDFRGPLETEPPEGFGSDDQPPLDDDIPE